MNGDHVNTHVANEPAEERPGLDMLVGASNAMNEVFGHIRQAASTDMPVLLLGETGTGKDLAAYAIHKLSHRSEGPYVPVNLGSLPSELVPSELFGYEKGAFTGASSRSKGKFEMAHTGTIFLDEIGTIDEKVQVSLLRLIEYKKFHRLGGKKAISTDMRLIAATNQDLSEALKTGAFREDLYYRLDVFRIVMPPLRDRPDDIPLLVDEFIQRYNKWLEKEIKGMDTDCMAALQNYAWPGNVRELKNVIQRAMLVADTDTIEPEHLPPRFRPEKLSPSSVTFEVGATLQEVEKQMIARTIQAARGNKRQAAELLGISRRALYNKLEKYKLK